MSSVTSKAVQQNTTKEGQPSVGWRVRLKTWLSSWEIYIIVLVAGFLRFYRLDRTEFDSDQADIFRMAYDAVHHGLLVAASNMASIHIYNPPAIIYILMLPAAFSSNPFWAAMLLATLTTLSVLFTYLFTRHYYGRLAGTLAALLYATASASVFYSRFIWQQNFLLFFVPLFIATLFLGTVSRRKGWLFPAIFLLGLLIQLHASTVTLAAALLVAWALAPGTVRWRDLAFGIISVAVIYFPYLLWESATHFQDVAILLAEMKQPSKIDNQAVLLYQQFLSPYPVYVARHSLFYGLEPFVSWLVFVMTALIIVAGLVALLLFVWPRWHNEAVQAHGVARVWHSIRSWWLDLRSYPYRCGLLVLLAWQGIPLLYLTRHAIALYPHYFIMLMPGPFILIGLLLAKASIWLRRPGGRAKLLYICVYLLSGLLILAQFAASASNVLDVTSGRFKDSTLSYPYYNDLSSLQRAVHAADQLAQQRHLSHLYVSTDFATETALNYLVTLTKTPATAFSDVCQVLPDPAEGSVAMLLGPHSDLNYALLSQFASVKLVSMPFHPGGPPFRLYIVQSSVPRRTASTTFSNNFQLLGSRRISFNNRPWIITHWNILRSVQPAFRTSYVYSITDLSNPDHNARDLTYGDKRTCTFTSMHAGDQMLVSFPLVGKEATQPAIDVQFQSYTLTPFIVAPRFLQPLGIAFETGFYNYTSQHVLSTVNRQDQLVLPTS
jgi:4-amino-4-deoxy-L-arabinose transferase-like glycosyltransferase